MSLFLDVILIAVMIVCVWYGNKNGFFKSIMNLISGIVSVLVAYTFSPALSAFLIEKFFLDSISSGITDAFASAAKATVDEAGNAVYDFAKMLENPQIITIARRYGVEEGGLEKMVNSAGEASYEAIENIAVSVADSVATVISDVCAFAGVFILAAIVLKIFTSIIGGIFKLPVLKTMDKGLGTVSGVIGALFFAWIISVVLAAVIPALITVAPGVVTEHTFNNTILIKFFAEHSPLDVFSGIVG